MKNNFWTINKKIFSKTFYEWEKKKQKDLDILIFIIAYYTYWILNIINKNKDIFILFINAL